MRCFLLLTGLWLLMCTARAASVPADTAALRIARLPAAGLLLTKGWCYHAGDDPAWARPDFDDRGWDTLNPTRLRRELPPALSTGISWLRLRFQLGDSLRRREVLLSASYLGATEIYVNGNLLRRDGVLSHLPTKVQATARRVEPLELPTGLGTVGVLAVRFAPYPGCSAAWRIRLIWP